VTAYVVGLTGGIGSGKTTVAELFRRAGAGIVDTDEIAHELTAPGGVAIPAIAEAFGPGFVAPDGRMDRAAMRRRVFEDSAARRRLEAILHPMIRVRSADLVARCDAPYALLVVPLLLDRGARREDVRRVLVVDCPEALQIERVMRRSGLSEAEVRAIIDAQIPRADRLAQADDVIPNDGDLAALERRVAALDRAYRARASSA
jgi:dephospho-CoA kinase